MDRVIALVDMDCFYVQVEQRLNPQLKGKPCAVVQYNPWKGGGIIAVGYEARACGVTRNMRGDDAKSVCPDINLIAVPQVRGKADLTKYRNAGAEVIVVLSQFSACVERASVDEAYIDITDEAEIRLKSLSENNKSLTGNMLPNTHIIGYDDKQKCPSAVEESDVRRLGVESWLSELNTHNEDRYYDKLLTTGGVIVEEMRLAVYEQTGFRCSAGVAPNKMLAKLVCGLHKPNKQSVLPQISVAGLFNSTPVRKVRNLGGKLGLSIVEQLGCETMADLTRISQLHLESVFGEKTGCWLYAVSRGIDTDPVNPRQLPKSIGCSKNFQGKAQLDTKTKVKHWLLELATELEERLITDREKNKRKAQTMTVSIRNRNCSKVLSVVSRSCSIVTYDKRVFADTAFILLKEFNTSHDEQWAPALTLLGLSAGKFKDVETSTSGLVSISKFLSQTPTTPSTQTQPSSSQQPIKRSTLTLSEMWSPNQQRIDQKQENTTEIDISESEESSFIDCSESYESKQLNQSESIRFATSTAPSRMDTRQNVLNPDEWSSTNTVHLEEANKQQNEKTQHSLSAQRLNAENSRSGLENSLSNDSTGFFGRKMRALRENCDSNASVTSAPGNYNESSNESGFFAMKMREIISKTNQESSNDENSVESTNSVFGAKNTTTTDDGKLDKTQDLKSSTNVKRKQEQSNKDQIRNQQTPLHINHEDNESSDVLNREQSLESTEEIVTEKFDSSDYMICKTCRKNVLIWNMPEHTDYHYAMEIQNQPTVRTTASATTSSSSTVKRKSNDSSSRKSKKTKLSSNSCMSLDQFFKPK
ncbi:DNA polymerase eta-like [Tubulanus polymorphus]|uniref:DNA polymerase eta-like n=1 Tax=Tubulanus polymorphus TaxID=672921 RepID=UPI003DA58D8F